MKTLADLWGVATGAAEGLPPLTEEQRAVVDAAREGKCVVVAAGAGCGKSMTALWVAHAVAEPTLILTYNRSLADETNEAIRRCNLSNVICRTYHAQVGIAAGTRGACSTDAQMLEITTQWASGAREVAVPIAQKLIILDELQDMRPSYYGAVMYMVPPDRQMMGVGDEHQLLYDYGAHDRASAEYLARADEMFAAKTLHREWVRRALSTSFRLTPNMVRFVNLMWGTTLRAGNITSPDRPVEYWCLSTYDPRLLMRLRALIDGCGRLDDVALLSPLNLKGAEGRPRPLQWVVNQLLLDEAPGSGRKYNFAIKTLEGGTSSHKNKVRAWTFNASKGCTIKCTVVFGFNCFKGRQPGTNQLGVAISRSNHRLIVVHDCDPKGRPQPYCKPLDSETLARLVDEGIVVAPDGVPCDVVDVPDEPAPNPIAVTAIKHLSAATVRQLLQQGAEVRRIPATLDIHVRMTHVFCTGVHATEEDVSAIYGVGIPFALERERKGSIKLVEAMLDPLLVEPAAAIAVDDLLQLLFDHNVVMTALDVLTLRAEFEPQPMRGSDVIDKLRMLRRQHAFLSRVAVCDRRRFDEIFAAHHIERARQVYSAPGALRARDYVYLANACIAMEGTHELFVQIGTDYAWVDEQGFARALSLLRRQVPVGDHECGVSVSLDPPVRGQRLVVDGIVGSLDVRIDAVTAYELKFVRELTAEHELQALLYAAILAAAARADASCVLLNSRTGEAVHKCIGPEPAATLLRAVAEAHVG